jgi:hypothetical protein
MLKLRQAHIAILSQVVDFLGTGKSWDFDRVVVVKTWGRYGSRMGLSISVACHEWVITLERSRTTSETLCSIQQRRETRAKYPGVSLAPCSTSIRTPSCGHWQRRWEYRPPHNCEPSPSMTLNPIQNQSQFWRCSHNSEPPSPPS